MLSGEIVEAPFLINALVYEGIDGAGISIPHHNKKNCSGVYVGMRDNLKSEILRESI